MVAMVAIEGSVAALPLAAMEKEACWEEQAVMPMDDMGIHQRFVDRSHGKYCCYPRSNSTCGTAHASMRTHGYTALADR